MAKYLEGADLGQLVRDQADAARRASMLPGNEWGSTWEGPVLVSLIGRPGLFEPAVLTYARHWAERFREFLTPGSPHWLGVPATLDDLWNLMYPARLFTPTPDPAMFDGIAGTLKSADIGIAFNTYEPESGIEYVHVNPSGLEMIKDTIPEAEYGLRLDDRVYEKITPEAVRNALWLLEYGFDRSADGRRLVDGKYIRSIIIDELAFADEIISVRPLSARWLGHLPQNLLERLDLQTELWFNASYRVQRDNIDLINKFLHGWRGKTCATLFPAGRQAGSGSNRPSRPGSSDRQRAARQETRECMVSKKNTSVCIACDTDRARGQRRTCSALCRPRKRAVAASSTAAAAQGRRR